ncbi:hypothetical protein H0H87_006616 [Tephrocybe sp. NHM501043]|nr:hypothetical protein H0H87_006616 [Tephrocybe sp. NHM501043]
MVEPQLSLYLVLAQDLYAIRLMPCRISGLSSHISVYSANETISLVPFFVGRPTLYTSNIDVMKQVVTGDTKASWTKDGLEILRTWGDNLVAAPDGEVWRRHRRIVGPAFDNALYQRVWAATLETYREMEVAEGWSTRDTVDIPAVQTITTKMALLIIAKCGFGLPVKWSAPPIGSDGNMAVHEALRVLVDSYIVSMLMPNWLTEHTVTSFAKIRAAFQAFTGFMDHEIGARAEEVRSGTEAAENRTDMFTMLVRANEQETGKLKLDDQEVIGNVFIMLFGGHETTAHTLSATLALLALHQEIQDEIWKDIVSVVGYDRDPVFNEYESLCKVLATFYEALRLFPSSYLMMRTSTEDTILNIPNAVGQDGNTPLVVHKGTLMMLDIIGMQYNPRHFPEPDEFRPSRWYNTSAESEAFSAFGIGPRACIGRKFALVEAVAFLTMFLRDWRVGPAFQEGEDPEAWRERVLSKPVIGLTLGIKGASVKLTRRDARN